MESVGDSHARRLVRFSVAGVLALSIAGKVVKPASTLHVLTSVWGLHANNARTTFFAILLVEATVLTLLLVRERLGYPVTLLYLSGITLSPIRQIIESSQIGCGCGLLPGFLQPRHQQLLGITVNLGLCISLWLAWPSAGVERDPLPDRS